VEIRVGLSTLLGLDDKPADLPGLGPTTAQVARNLIARQHRAEWRYAILDPTGYAHATGLLRARPSRPDPDQADGGLVELHLAATDLHALTASDHPDWTAVLQALTRAQNADPDPSRQQPTARYAGTRLRRHLHITHRHCTMPTCRRPATACDADHLHQHARGGPTTETNLHPACPTDHALHTRGGWTVHRNKNGTITWTSPLGRHHTRDQPPVAEPLPDPQPRHHTERGPDPPPQ
jgi:hypothetical protein